MLVDLLPFWVNLQSVSSLRVTHPCPCVVLQMSQQFLSVGRQLGVSQLNVKRAGPDGWPVVMLTDATLRSGAPRVALG